jgi:hypothetical protein
VMKGMFLCKCGCQDIQPAIAFYGDKGYWTQWRRLEDTCKNDELS